MIGKTISHYRITEKLGEGGMGVVYKAFDTKLERDVALKLLRPEAMGDPAAKERFIREARAASALNHPNITTIYEIDEWHGQDFICMEYVEGETVKKKIQSGQMSLDDVLNIATQTAEALQEAHEHDITHRDIKSENIMVTPKGQVKVMDFGLAKLKGVGGLTKNGTTLGTISYMSPEQARGEDVDHRTDIWSFGVVLYEMITGQLPFKGEYEQAVIYSIMNEEPKPLKEMRSDTPNEWEQITNKAMAKDLDNRYQFISEMMIDLKNLRQEKDSFDEIRSSNYMGKKAKTKRIKIISMSVGIFLFLIIGFFLVKPYLFQQIEVKEKIPIAIISFENHTGDKSYDHLQKVIPNLLITKLEQCQYLQVTTWERMHDLIRQLGKEDVEVIDKDLAFEVCRLDGVNAVVLGSYAKLGNMFATEVKLLDVETKRTIRSASSQGEGEDSILRQIDELGKEISSGIGLSARKIEQNQQSIRDVTTTSMEAYNYFIRGQEEYRKKYYKDAKLFLEKAVQLDSTFAIAHLWLAWANSYLGDVELKKKHYEEAKKYSIYATKKEQLYINAIQGNGEKWLNYLKEIIKKYPKEKEAYYDLGSWYRGNRRYNKAIEKFNRVLELDPNFEPALNSLVYCYANMGDFEKAIEYLKRYASVSPGDADPYDSMGDIYLRMGKFDKAIVNYKMAFDIKPDFLYNWKSAYVFALNEDFFGSIKFIDQYMSRSKSYSKNLYFGHLYKGFQYGWLGKIDLSLIELNKALEFSKEIIWDKSFVEYIKGHVHFDRGAFENSRECFQEWYRLVLFSQFKQNFPVFNILNFCDLGMVDLQQGRIDSAKHKLSLAQAMLPEIIEANKAWATRVVTYFQGEVLLAEGSVEDAIAVYKKFIRRSPDSFTISPVLYHNTPFITDGLPRAYQHKGDIIKAIAEYERLIESELKNVHSLIHPKLHYRLAKLYQEKGEIEKAISEYEKFLDLWREADQDLPELIDAKKRLKELTVGK